MVLKLSVTSKGRQYDRLGSIYLGDVEIFRTSTAEPSATGIEWSYHKDVTPFLALFKGQQKVIFDLGNLINEIYTAPFDVIVEAVFYKNAIAPDTADRIIPISARRSDANQPSAFSLPGDHAVNTIEFPRNVRRAVVLVLATGQGQEEFWFGNTLASGARGSSAGRGPQPGSSPFREVQLLIDGALAGVISPFPIIFTGGFNPSLWRPIVGIDAFDLREGEIDITPWVPLLCDARKGGHDFEIRVVGVDDDGNGHGKLSASVGNNWIVSGKVLVWLDVPGFVTTGSRLSNAAPEPAVTVRSTKADSALDYSVQVDRHLSISSRINTSKGPQVATWSQTVNTQISGVVNDDGETHRIKLLTSQTDAGSGGFAAEYHFQARLDTLAKPDPEKKEVAIDGKIDRSQSISVHGSSLLTLGRKPPSTQPKRRITTRPNSQISSYSLHTNQVGSYRTLVAPDGSLKAVSASTGQDMTFNRVDGRPSPPRTESYHRRVYAENGALIKDEETLDGTTRDNRPLSSGPSSPDNYHQLATNTDRHEIVGRLPKAIDVSGLLAALAQSSLA